MVRIDGISYIVILLNCVVPHASTYSRVGWSIDAFDVLGCVWSAQTTNAKWTERNIFDKFGRHAPARTERVGKNCRSRWARNDIAFFLSFRVLFFSSSSNPKQFVNYDYALSKQRKERTTRFMKRAAREIMSILICFALGENLIDRADVDAMRIDSVDYESWSASPKLNFPWNFSLHS